ncbi:hypothetical protein CLV49_0634 [Labedella gwakjiensis]|uniref:Uncharacterized protein n=1 Tax=Labedella gwakjiensis TaxID=390269 RepID=A0A2P8GST0_9MICO|nr:hypothetical protein [Labedella gwakjiensis]PSL37028.1 hypothetical protein CLV49_0634 [Labedella gwakjiensis]RUQ81815.1 hypothetical protein ELQ93_17435 [Labedella gwakjiensis]
MMDVEDDHPGPVPALTRASLTSSVLAIVAAIAAYVTLAGLFGSSPSRALSVLFPLGVIAAVVCAILALILAIADIVRSRGFARSHTATHAALFLSILLAAPALAIGGPYASGVAGQLWQGGIGQSIAYSETVEAEYDAQLDDHTVLLEPLVDTAIELADGSIAEDAAEQNTRLGTCDGGRWVTFAADVIARAGDAERIVEAWQAAGLTFTHRSGGDVESWTYVRSSTSPYPLVEADVTRTPSGDGERLTVSLISSCVGDGLSGPMTG